MISIVIPYFERLQLVTEAIGSVLRSTQKQFEIIVVDDGSSEAEWTRVAKLASEKVKVVRRADGNKGPSRCRNLGAACSSSGLLMFMDSDDLMAPWCLQQRLEAASANPGFDCWIFPVLLFREIPGDLTQLWNRLETGVPDINRFARSDPPWQTSSPLWRKTAFHRLGGFNEMVSYGDDTDLHLRALASQVGYRKFPTAVPDVFIRRSSVPRITNTLTEETVETRLVRLREGTRFLKGSRVHKSVLRDWEGQYFVEAEFLLFNFPNAKRALASLLRAWNEDLPPAPSGLIRIYLSVARATRSRAYFILRLFRRMAILLLPAEFFPLANVSGADASEQIMREVRDRIRERDSAGI